MSRPARLTVSLAALRHNLARVRQAAPQAKIMAAIKADAYGHGLLRCAHALEDADALAVACLEEALPLRAAGIKQPVVLLQGFFQTNELPELAAHSLQPVIHCAEQIEQLGRARLSQPLRVWLKIDTGMHRLGFLPEQAAAARARLLALPQVAALDFLTHLACADERGNSCTLGQLTSFQHTVQGWEGERSIANSAGILGWPQTHADWVRPGIMLYGASPFVDSEGPAEGLRAVMSLDSALTCVHQYRRGMRVGYGGSWQCPEDMPVGVVAIGYGDGYPRHAAAGTPVLLNGREVPLVGRVSMDMICVDLRSQPQARPGDPVQLWGEQLPAERIARSAATIPYALFTGVTARVPRTYTTS